MKKVLFSLVLALLTLTLVACGQDEGNATTDTSGEEEPTQLVISTWGFAEDFFQENVYGPFEEENNVEIVLETGGNADRLSKVRQGSSSVDLIYLSDYYAQQGIEEGLFETIDRTNIPNLEEIYEVAKAPLGEDFGPAYTIAQFGLAYNADLVGQELTSWADLWSLDADLAIPGITSTTGPMFLDAASRVAGSDSFNEDLAFKKLAELSPNVIKEYTSTSDFVNMFAQGEIVGGPVMEMFFGSLKEAVPSAQFVTPEEGAYAVINTINIVKDSENKELAEKFINFILSAEIQKTAAVNKIDSPVNTTIELTEEEAAGLTYGKDVINNLIQLDMGFVNENSDSWIDRWNRELAQ